MTTTPDASTAEHHRILTDEVGRRGVDGSRLLGDRSHA